MHLLPETTKSAANFDLVAKPLGSTRPNCFLLLTKDIRCCFDPGFSASPQELPLQTLSRPFVLCAACCAGLEQALSSFDLLRLRAAALALSRPWIPLTSGCRAGPGQALVLSGLDLVLLALCRPQALPGGDLSWPWTTARPMAATSSTSGIPLDEYRKDVPPGWQPGDPKYLWNPSWKGWRCGTVFMTDRMKLLGHFLQDDFEDELNR